MDQYLVETFKEKLSTLSDYHGLISPGLTCYLNSVLQVLFMTPDFREAIQTWRQSDEETIDPYLKELFFHLEKNQARTHHVAAALAITDVYRQRDAAEYLEKILSLTSPEASKVFRGELNHMTICSRCEDRNEATACFWVLPLSVEDSCPTYSVNKGLDQYFRGQTVSGDNKMYCNSCDEKTDAFIRCELTRAPDVLTLLLKRFHFNSKFNRFIKLQHSIDMAHTLHIKGCMYELYALINHSGDLTGGHYTAHIRSFDTGAWYDFNDNTVQLVKQPLSKAGKTTARSSTPYLLMYKKKRNGPDQSNSVKQKAGKEKATPPGCSPPLRGGGWGDTSHDSPESREDNLVQMVTPQKSKLAKQETCTKPKSRLKSTERPMRSSEESSAKQSHDSNENRLKTEPRSTSGTRHNRNMTETGDSVRGLSVKHNRETQQLLPIRPESKHRPQPLEGARQREKDRRRPENTHRGPWRL